jgi:carbamate kinase
VAAVVDKDLAAALLARELDADALVLLTDVPGVVDGFGGPHPRLVTTATPAELRALALPAGSMGPKAEAACRFAEATGRPAAIGRLEEATEVLAGRAGTTVRPPVAGRAGTAATDRGVTPGTPTTVPSRESVR